MKKVQLLLLGSMVLLLWNCSEDANNTNSEEDAPVAFIARTPIPDAAFERALIELGIDDVEDGSVVTSDIQEITSLIMNDKGITSLSGIGAFPRLENLSVNDNLLSTVDLSGNTLLKFVYIENNGLTSITVDNLTILEKLSLTNNSLSQLDLTDNPSLQLLGLANNDLGSIDISMVPSSIQLNTFSVANNPLTCIKVNQAILGNIPSQWTKDAEDDYALECN